MNKRYLEAAKEYIAGLGVAEQGTIDADIKALCSGEFDGVHTKQLRGSIRELIVGHHRLTYFVLGDTFYFIRGFRKKTAKTPKSEIEYAEKVYKMLTSDI